MASSKLAYLYEIDGANGKNSGVSKKVRFQCGAFERAGMDCELICLPNMSSGSPARKFLKRLPLFPDWIEWPSLSDLEGFDAFYVRKPNYISHQFVRFLKGLRRDHPKAPIVMEVPTYPYERELMHPQSVTLLLKDLHNRKALRGVIDRIADIYGHESIFGIPTISITNGVDFDALRPRAPHAQGADDPIVLVCAACFSPWHGIDRLIAGLAAYRDGSSGPRRKVRLELLGDGPSVPALKSQVEQLGLGDVVTFHGQCDQAQMDKVFDRSTLGVDCLGNHRKGLVVSSSLKSREYLAKGLPFVYAGRIDVLERWPADFALQLPECEDPIDVDAVIRFCDRIYGASSVEGVTRRIRGYGISHVGIDAALSEATDYLKSRLGP